MVNAKLRESLDAEFCQKALNAVRVAALRNGKNNEQILVHLTLSRGKGFFPQSIFVANLTINLCFIDAV